MRILIFFAVAFALSLILVAVLLARRYFRFRGKAMLTCPETNLPVAVELDARHVAVTDLIGDADLRLRSCSRWPERQGCGQQCLAEVEAAPEDCLIRNRLARWYEGARCELCGRDIGEILWSEHKPGLMSRDRRTIEWADIAAENLPLVLATHHRICWNCLVAESFRAQFPDRVLDDPLRFAERPAGRDA